jgi:hypothetical protein
MTVKYKQREAAEKFRDNIFIDTLLRLYTDMLVYLGVKKISFEKHTDGGVEHILNSIFEVQQGIPVQVEKYAKKICAAFSIAFYSVGLNYVEIELSDREINDRQKEWNSAPDMLDDTIVDKEQTRVLYEQDRSERVSVLYEIMADLLPLEGRDFVLNASDNDEGGVHMEPVAYTKVGKMWLEYLAEALPQYTKMSEEEREAFLEKRHEDKS